jgi:hypothetical protein
LIHPSLHFGFERLGNFQTMETKYMNCQTIRASIDTATRRTGYSESVHVHLRGCDDCRRHADEMSSLLALIGAAPRVEAPADFNFRVRAGIARAKSEPQVEAGLITTLGKFWSQSFSLGQAAAAMAAVAVAVTASSFYFTNPNQMATPTVPSIAAAPPVVQPRELAMSAAPRSSQPLRVAKSAPVRTIARAAKPQPVQPAGLTTAATVEVAKADASSSFYANGQVIRNAPNRDLIGAEAALAKAQPALSF